MWLRLKLASDRFFLNRMKTGPDSDDQTKTRLLVLHVGNKIAETLMNIIRVIMNANSRLIRMVIGRGIEYRQL